MFFSLITPALLYFFLVFGSPAYAQSSSADLLSEAERYWIIGDIAQARQAFEQAVALEPQQLEARLKFAGFLLSQQQYRDSVKQYQAILALQPDNAKAFIGLGLAYLHNGERGLARAALREAKKLTGADADKAADIQVLLDSLVEE